MADQIIADPAGELKVPLAIAFRYDEGKRIQDLGHFFAAVDVTTFMPLDEFRARMNQLVREVHSQPRQPGVERIYVPGEIEQERIAESQRTGLSLSAIGCAKLDRLAERLGVTPLSGRRRPGSFGAGHAVRENGREVRATDGNG
ncbi:MAG: Ldh family oxidoreductase [Anaerolineae bacterium]